MEDSDPLAEAATHYFRAVTFCRDWRFIMEIEQERWRDMRGVIAISCPACGKPRIVGRACGHCGAQ